MSLSFDPKVRAWLGWALAATLCVYLVLTALSLTDGDAEALDATAAVASVFTIVAGVRLVRLAMGASPGGTLTATVIYIVLGVVLLVVGLAYGENGKPGASVDALVGAAGPFIEMLFGAAAWAVELQPSTTNDPEVTAADGR